MPSLKRDGSHLLRNASHLVNDCGVATDCCPDDLIPETLNAAVTWTDCACGTTVDITLTYDSGSAMWIGSGTAAGCTNQLTLNLLCNSGTWRLDTDVCDGGGTDQELSPDSASCDPLILTFSNTAFSGYQNCCDSLLADPTLEVEITI